MLNANRKDREAAAGEEAGMTVRQRLRQKRELEEKRKFGLAPLAVDEVTGNEISPNVPCPISQAPWYYGVSGPTLDHQRQKKTDVMDRLNDQQDTVIVLGKKKMYVPGACGNCGSGTHKTSECYKPRKKVGAMYSGKVTGVDILVERAEKSYSQKRDRYAMGAGVDLLQQASQDGGDDEEKKKGCSAAGSMGCVKDSQIAHVFAAQTAVTGGAVEIKELPKHLQNLDDGNVLFDPKTGSMRGNPNAADPTRTFQGDLQRYRSGDYYTYLEMQLRFLNGESKSIVDFKLDEQLQEKKRQRLEGKDESNKEYDINTASCSEEETVQERLVRSLYGGPALASTVTSSRTREEALRGVIASTPSLSAPPPSPSLLPEVRRHFRMGPVTRNGHICVYGSYFDRNTFQWGYKCCKRLGKDATACHLPQVPASLEESAEQSCFTL